MKFARFRHGYFSGKIFGKTAFSRQNAELHVVRKGQDMSKRVASAFKILCLAFNAMALFLFGLAAFSPKIEGASLFVCAAGLALLNSLFSFTPLKLHTALLWVYRMMAWGRPAILCANGIALLYLMVFSGIAGANLTLVALPYAVALIFALQPKFSYLDRREAEIARAIARGRDGKIFDADDIDTRVRAGRTLSKSHFYRKASAKFFWAGIAFGILGGLPIVIDLTRGRSISLLFVGLFLVGATLLILSFSAHRACRKAERHAALEMFGLSRKDIKHIEKNAIEGDTRDMLLQEVFVDYRRKHLASVEKLEAQFKSIMSGRYGFTDEFTRQCLIRAIGRYQVSNAIFWHREGISADVAARDTYNKYATALNKNNPAIFARDIKTGRVVEKSAEAAFWIWALDGNVTTQGKVLLIGCATFFLLAMYLKLGMAQVFTPSELWTKMISCLSVAGGAVFFVSVWRKNRRFSPQQKRAGVLRTAFGGLFLAGLLWFPLMYAGGSLANMVLGRPSRQTVPIVAANRTSCVKPVNAPFFFRFCLPKKDARKVLAAGMLDADIWASWVGMEIRGYHLNG